MPVRTVLLSVLASAAIAAPSWAGTTPEGPARDYEAFAALHRRLLDGETAEQLEDALPGLARNLEIARRVSAAHWTDSTTFDELAKADILPARVLDGLGIARRRDSGVTHVPAGVMHTYGYLFSQLQTAYGLKGKRWLESRLDERLGLAAGSFGPRAGRGEFASNVTAALLTLAGERPKLAHAAPLAPSAKVIGRLEQRVVWKTPRGKVTAVVVTRLVELGPLPGAPPGEAALLVYEVVRGWRRRLVTAFPVDQAFADRLIAAPASEEPAFVPRFNLYVPSSWKVTAQRSSGFQRAQ